MDSSGIGLIIGRYKNVKATGGKTALCGATECVEKVIRLSGIEKIVPMVKTYDEAEAIFKHDETERTDKK